jgi:YopT peptidase
MIAIMGNGGHAMAAYVGSDVAFFDPNFGEFWFPTQRKFYDFFLNFWRTSGYESEFSSYFLQPYAKAV